MEDNVIAGIRRILHENQKQQPDETRLLPAGVLVLFYRRKGEYCVLLNRRSHTVSTHKGEISFPGGGMEKNDRNLLETALRETHEEMGINPEQVKVLGELDKVATVSKYMISAFVGTIHQSTRFKPNEQEVAEVIEVPVKALTNKDNIRNEASLVHGTIHQHWAYVYDSHLIWGATARILKLFLNVLDHLQLENNSREMGHL